MGCDNRILAATKTTLPLEFEPVWRWNTNLRLQSTDQPDSNERCRRAAL